MRYWGICLKSETEHWIIDANGVPFHYPLKSIAEIAMMNFAFQHEEPLSEFKVKEFPPDKIGVGDDATP